MFEGPIEQLSQTRYTQPCMAVFAAGVTKVLYENGIKPDYAAGLSLGEYSALYSAGVFDEDTFIKLVAFRGKVMEEAAQGIECKMSAVMGLESYTLEKICEEVRGEDVKDENYVTVSNYNCKGQYVICGNEAAVAKAEEKAKEAGAKRCIALKVSGPFHTKYMKPAGDALKEYFENINFNEMRHPVIFNTTAKEIEEGQNIPELLEKQVQSSIYMEKTIERLKEKGVDTVIEIGPGKALSGFVKKTVNGITTYVIEDMKGLNEVIDKIKM
jgi:[acyl-carrier-protein] S-malonyltransferase